MCMASQYHMYDFISPDCHCVPVQVLLKVEHSTISMFVYVSALCRCRLCCLNFQLQFSLLLFNRHGSILYEFPQTSLAADFLTMQPQMLFV